MRHGRWRSLGSLPALTPVLLALGCGNSSVTTPAFPDSASLTASSQRDAAPALTLGTTGVTPQISHVDRPASVRVTNADSVPRRLTEAPELGYGPCPELASLGSIAPGASASLVLTRSGLCAFRDEERGTNRAFQGVIVIH